MVVLYDRIQRVEAEYISDFYPNNCEGYDRIKLRVKIFEENNQ
uniref:Uncharacterized protein n=1 Tax=Panagrolaimus sp. JU765 TaxID=591449 RepID=A0AC34RD57_9BILA